jgi:hypothetical protein
MQGEFSSLTFQDGGEKKPGSRRLKKLTDLGVIL